jgi:hypothetical protein
MIQINTKLDSTWLKGEVVHGTKSELLYTVFNLITESEPLQLLEYLDNHADLTKDLIKLIIETLHKWNHFSSGDLIKLSL